MASIIKTSINLSEIPKDKIFVGKKGKYLPITITLNDEVDQFGNQGPVVVEQTKDEREAKQAKTYLGIVPQEFNFNTFEPVNEIIINQAGYYGIPTENSKAYCDELLIKLGQSEKRNQVARNLSRAKKRRLMNARA